MIFLSKKIILIKQKKMVLYGLDATSPTQGQWLRTSTHLLLSFWSWLPPFNLFFVTFFSPWCWWRCTSYHDRCWGNQLLGCPCGCSSGCPCALSITSCWSCLGSCSVTRPNSDWTALNWVPLNSKTCPERRRCWM